MDSLEASIFLNFPFNNFFLFRNESLYIILYYFIFPQMCDYKFNSFSHVKLICDFFEVH